MKNSIRGCISCILPCGALDVIRIVHSNGRIEELTTRTINAADVARGDRSGEDGIPMLLSIIGFGDIILSGLLVAFSLRYDWLAKRNLRSGYFVWAMSAYGLGLLLTYVALNLMDGHGQPALLYIVPFTLGTFLLLEKKRGELNLLWIRGEPEMPCPHNQESQQ
ncbi:hypothetical protein Ahy_B04g072122 [Arachis hypogaea]|uniref:Uncharacterized protein n=1 Tax=Arachis hypogaea TaxID=3818 RepID=A0A444ZMI0_ARAHY|nr:hypothetical protein Ahy_B04g072122 [Arachis hypogaea]